jgi:outer membrane protein OmpA-like peptidoglycan-associated protein
VIAAAREPLRTEEPAATLDSCRELKQARAPISIQFEFASSSLDKIAVASLEGITDLLRRCTSAAVSIEGHTSSDGDAERNHALSVRRANEVRAHLASAGLNSSRLTAIGFGPSRPQAPNTTPENKRANRRVELKISIPN